MHILATRLDYKENALQIVTMCNHRKVLVSYYLFIIYPKLFFLINFGTIKTRTIIFFIFFYLWRQDLRVNTGSCASADF